MAENINTLKDKRKKFLKERRKLALGVKNRYKHPVQSGFVAKSVDKDTEFKPGTMIEFDYGSYKPPREVGGWHYDPKPRVLVISHSMEDNLHLLDGINVVYLSYYYLLSLYKITSNGKRYHAERLFDDIKRIAPHAIKRGYRRYIKTSMKKVNQYVYGHNFEQNPDGTFKKSNKRKQTFGLKSGPDHKVVFRQMRDSKGRFLPR